MKTISIKTYLYYILAWVLSVGIWGGQTALAVDSNTLSLAGYTFTLYDSDGTTPKNLTPDGSSYVEVSGSPEKNVDISLSDGDVLHIKQDNSNTENYTQLAITVPNGSATVKVEDLNIQATQAVTGEADKADGNPTAGISLSAGSQLTIELVGTNKIYSTSSYAMNVAGHLTLDGSTAGKLSVKSDTGYGIRLPATNTGIDPAKLTIAGGTIDITGTIGIGRNSEQNNIFTMEGGYVTVTGTTDVAVNVAYGQFHMNGGELTVKGAGSYDIYGPLYTPSNWGSGVLIHYNLLTYQTGQTLANHNILAMDLSENQTDPYNTLYNSSTVVSNSAKYFGRVYGNVRLEQDFAIEEEWLVDLPESSKLRYRKSDLDGVTSAFATDYSFLTILPLEATVDGKVGELRFQGVGTSDQIAAPSESGNAPLL